MQLLLFFLIVKQQRPCRAFSLTCSLPNSWLDITSVHFGTIKSFRFISVAVQQKRKITAARVPMHSSFPSRHPFIISFVPCITIKMDKIEVSPTPSKMEFHNHFCIFTLPFVWLEWLWLSYPTPPPNPGICLFWSFQVVMSLPGPIPQRMS